MLRVRLPSYVARGSLMLFIALLWAAPLASQTYIDLAKLSYAVTPNNNFDNGQDGNPINEWNLQIDLPVVLDKKSVLITGFTGNSLNVGLDPSLSDGSQLYTLGIRLGMNQVYSDTWSATYLLLPKFSSDFSNGFRDGFQLGVATLFSKTYSKRLKFTFGVFTNTEEYGQLVVPLFGGYYLSPDNRFEATLLLPSVAEINYAVGTKIRLGMNFDGLGATYVLQDSNFSHAYVTKSSNEIFSYIRFPLTRSVLLNIKAGYSVFRSYKVYDRDDKVDLSLATIYIGDNRTVLNTGFKDNFIFKFDLIYRFHLEKKPSAD